MSSDGFLTGVASSISGALAPLADATEPDALGAILARLGWTVPPDQSVATEFSETASTVGDLVADVNSGAAAATLVADVIAAVTALGDLRTTVLAGVEAPFDDAAFWAGLPEEVMGLLIAEALEAHAAGLYGVLSLLGAIRSVAVAADAATGRSAYVARVVDWSGLVRAVASPATLMEDAYGWGTRLDHVKLLDALGALARGIGAGATVMPLQRSFAMPFIANDNPDRLNMKQLVAWPFTTPAASFDALVNPALVVTPLPPVGGPSSVPDGLLLIPVLTGSAQAEIALVGGATLTIEGEIQANPMRIALRPEGATLEQGSTEGELEVRIDFAPATPVLLGGVRDGTRFELSRAHLAFTTTAATNGLEASLDIGLDDARAVLDLADSNGLIRGVLGNGRIELGIAFGVTWSTSDGLKFAGNATPSIAIPCNVVIGNVLAVTEIQIALEPGATDGTARTISTATGSAMLGPVQLSFDRMGIAVDAATRTLDDPGNIGLLDVGLGFEPPRGVGVALDVGVVSGGGYLDIDTTSGAYQGVIDVDVLGVGISAVVIVETDVPGVDGFSMFFALFLDLPSIQLGFGFTLTGVGGVAGINRTLDPEALSAAVRSGSLDAVLFPEDPIAQAPVIIDTYKAIFPAADGQVVFGPMVRIGWGTPTLVEAELGIVLALPDPVVISMVGSVTSILPDPDVDLVAVNLDIGGTIDFDEMTLTLSAGLHDSHVVGFSLSGGMELRADFGSRPSFLMALGGFHPDFEAPPGFPSVDRLRLALSSNPLFNVSFECYLALTSNTVQFGSALDLSAEVAGFEIAGGASFDALVQFTPFMVSTDLGFYITVKAVGIDLAGVWLDISVDGPNPWVIDGLARFEVLGFEEEVPVHETIGTRRSEPELDPEDPRDAIVAALNASDSWSVVTLPSGGGVTLTSNAFAAGTLLASPDATLAVGQRVVPLGIELEHVGNAPIGDFTRFEIEARANGLALTGELVDWFAPAEFFDLTRIEAISGPSFEQFANGVTLGGGEPTAGGPVESTLDYEQILRDPTMGIESLTLDETTNPLADARPLVATAYGAAPGVAASYSVTIDDSPRLLDIDYAAVDRLSGVESSRSATWSGARSGVGRNDVIVPTWELKT